MKEANNITNMNRTFIMAKVKPEETDINKAIKEGFEDPYNYLKLNSNVIVGKIILYLNNKEKFNLN